MTTDIVPLGKLVKKLAIQFNVGLAIEALNEVKKRYVMDEEKRQINLTYRPGETVYNGAGTLFDQMTQMPFARERDFRSFASEFSDSYFAEIYRETERRTGYQLARARLMLLQPRACYSMHRDPTIRFHLPLITNPRTFMVFRRGYFVHLPADGHIYYTDTRYEHTAMNNGTENRIHFVMTAAEQV